MKSIVFVLLSFAATVGCVARAGDIEAGMTRAQVIAKLGAPEGEARAGNGEILLYERGNIELLDGKVFRSTLLTEEEQALRLEQEAKQKEREAAESEARRQEGTAERDRILQSPAFKQKTAAERVVYWQAFERKYPEVGADPVSYQTALRELQEEQEAAAATDTADATGEEDPGPKPRVSSREMRKMKRAGTWKW